MSAERGNRLQAVGLIPHTPQAINFIKPIDKRYNVCYTIITIKERNNKNESSFFFF
jgi:hypothetical protein